MKFSSFGEGAMGTMKRFERWRRRLPYFTLRSWALLGLALFCLASFSISDIWTRYRHRQVADRLRALGVTVDFSTRINVTPKAPWFVKAWENAKDLYLNPRVSRVVFRPADPDKLESAITLLQQLGAVPNIASYDAKLDESQIDRLLQSVTAKTLFIQGVSLPRTRIPCLNYQPLEWICVARTQFSNPAIADLPDSLTYFDATRTRITDDGLSEFQRLKNLKTLWLRRTPTTKAAVDNLKKQMPWCKIEWEPMVERP